MGDEQLCRQAAHARLPVADHDKVAWAARAEPSGAERARASGALLPARYTQAGEPVPIGGHVELWARVASSEEDRTALNDQVEWRRDGLGQDRGPRHFGPPVGAERRAVKERRGVAARRRPGTSDYDCVGFAGSRGQGEDLATELHALPGPSAGSSRVGRAFRRSPPLLGPRSSRKQTGINFARQGKFERSPRSPNVT